jgi:hypothetical protein
MIFLKVLSPFLTRYPTLFVTVSLPGRYRAEGTRY